MFTIFHKKEKIQRDLDVTEYTHICTAFLKRHTSKHWLPLDFGNKRKRVEREREIFIFLDYELILLLKLKKQKQKGGILVLFSVKVFLPQNLSHNSKP